MPGIGKKSAQRIILELKEKINKSHFNGPIAALSGMKTDIQSDLISSLVNLGYKEKTAESMASDILKTQGTDIDLESALKLALKKLVN